MKSFRNEIVIGIIGVLLAIPLFVFPAPSDRILNIQNYLITVGGIISAFVIAYLSGKIFNLRTERENRQVKINKYGRKLTTFRRLLFYVMHSRNFWVYYDDISKFKKKYPHLNYERLHGQGEDELRRAFWLDEKDLESSTVDLYLAMEAIYGDLDAPGIPWALDKSVSFDYSLDDLTKYHDPSNQIWYYLDGRYGKHGAGRFNDEGIWVLYEKYIPDTFSKISSKFKGKDFHRLILAEIASKFYGQYIPKMYELIQKNTGIPRSLIITFYSLLSIMLFGVMLPIFIQSLSITIGLNIFLTLFFVWATIVSILKFIFDFFKFLDDDVHVVKNSG
jgi:hypothetical protein